MARLELLALVLLVVSCAQLGAQCHLPIGSKFGGRAGDNAKSNAEPLLPESGLLTDDTYTNLYFGISFRLPISIHGHRLMLPISLPDEHALLAIGFQEGQHYGTLVVTAGDHREGEDRNITPEQAERREDDIARSKPGPGPMTRLDYTPAPIKLKRVDKHSGQVRGSQFSARLRNYTVRFTIQSNDKAFLEQARQSIEDMRVFCTDDAGRFFTTDGKPFAPRGAVTNGPTIPTAIVDEAISSHPTEQTIPTGTLASGGFRISQLDFSYMLPAGWITTQHSLTEEDTGVGDTLSARTDDFWNACAKTPLYASSGMNRGARLELRVLDQSCFGLPAPAAVTDSVGGESLGRYLEMLGRFGKIKSDRLVQSGGRLFFIYEGTIAAGPPISKLSQRDTEIIVVTRFGKLLFAWCWSASTMSELIQVPNSEARFGSSAPIAIGPAMITLRNSSQP